MVGLVNSADSHVLEPVDLWQREQAVLADIFDGVPDEIRTAITGGNFARLFTVPHPAVP
jgi:hypothetical protein